MRVIHTSDWHLGQTFKGHERYHEHQVFLDWLIDTLVERQADALLIAGDVFDQANPAARAQTLFYHFLARARQQCPQLDMVVIAGNHDSPARIDAPQRLLRELGVHVLGHFAAREPPSEELLQRVLIPLSDRSGRTAAQVLAVPFLRAADLPAHPDGYGAAVAQTYAQLAERISARRGEEQALILMGHLHIQGGDLSPDSERRLVIGGEEALSSSTFPPAAYVALGHLHKPQQAGSPHIRYSGSPLPLSFAERQYRHQVLEVDFEGPQLSTCSAIPIPRPAEMMRVPETAAPLEQVLLALSELQIEPSAPGLEPLIEIQLEADTVPVDLRARIEQALAGRSVRLCGINRHYSKASAAGRPTAEPRLSLGDLQPEPLFQRLLDEREIADSERARLLACFHELLDAAAQEQAG